MNIIQEPSPLLEGNFLLHYRTSNYIAKSIPFLLLIKNAVSDITVNIRKATKKKKEKQFPFYLLSAFHAEASTRLDSLNTYWEISWVKEMLLN